MSWEGASAGILSDLKKRYKDIEQKDGGQSYFIRKKEQNDSITEEFDDLCKALQFNIPIFIKALEISLRSVTERHFQAQLALEGRHDSHEAC